MFILLPFFLLHFKSSQFFLTHDGRFHMERTFYEVMSLREGDVPPTWSRFYNNGLGSPILLFLFPIPYFVSSLFFAIGFNLVSALKLSFFFFQCLMVLSLFFWLRKGMNYSKAASLFGSLIALYAPYHFVQVFVRGALREFASAAIFPLVLLSLSNLEKHDQKKYVGQTAIMIGIFLLTDGITAAIFSVPMILYSFWLFYSSKKRKSFVISFGLALFLGLCIASYIYLPLLVERQYLKETTANLFQDHFVYWWQFFDPHWGFGFSLPGAKDGMSFQVGVLNDIAIAIFFFLLAVKKIKKSTLTIGFSFILVLSFLLMVQSPFIFHIWERAPFLKEIQLPWRLLSPVVFISAFFAASIILSLKFSRTQLIIAAIMVIASSIKYLRTNNIALYDQSYLLSNSSDATAWHEFIPKWRDTTSHVEGFLEKVEIASGEGNIQNLTIKNSRISFNVMTEQGASMRVNTFYFPGWEAFIDQKKVPIVITLNAMKPYNSEDKRDLSGLMQITVPEGAHNVSFQFTDTPIRKIGKIISLLELSGSLALLVWRCRGLTSSPDNFLISRVHA